MRKFVEYTSDLNLNRYEDFVSCILLLDRTLLQFLKKNSFVIRNFPNQAMEQNFTHH